MVVSNILGIRITSGYVLFELIAGVRCVLGAFQDSSTITQTTLRSGLSARCYPRVQTHPPPLHLTTKNPPNAVTAPASAILLMGKGLSLRLLALNGAIASVQLLTGLCSEFNTAANLTRLCIYLVNLKTNMVPFCYIGSLFISSYLFITFILTCYST